MLKWLTWCKSIRGGNTKGSCFPARFGLLLLLLLLLLFGLLLFRGSNTKGSCFPARFGGRCSGTPPECQECNRVKNCESSQEPELVVSLTFICVAYVYLQIPSFTCALYKYLLFPQISISSFTTFYRIEHYYYSDNL